jgi:hypothetical protein
MLRLIGEQIIGQGVAGDREFNVETRLAISTND